MSLTHNPLLYRASVRDHDIIGGRAEHVRYHALVSIHVPNDKARAVVDAMERDMGTTIATKADLQLLRQEMATKVDLAGLRQEFALLRKDLDSQATGFHKDLELLSTTMTVRLGSMLVVGFGVMIAALKFLQS
jgi:hypothetical protein